MRIAEELLRQTIFKQVWKVIQEMSGNPLIKEKIVDNAKRYEKDFQYQKYLDLYSRIVNKECGK